MNQMTVHKPIDSGSAQDQSRTFRAVEAADCLLENLSHLPQAKLDELQTRLTFEAFDRSALSHFDYSIGA